MVTLTLPLGYIFLPRKVNNYLGTVHRSLSTSPPLQVAKSFRAFVFIIKKKCTVPHPFHVRLFQDSADMSLVLYFFLVSPLETILSKVFFLSLTDLAEVRLRSVTYFFSQDNYTAIVVLSSSLLIFCFVINNTTYHLMLYFFFF